jgi:pyruvate dehydrogenase E1 component
MAYDPAFGYEIAVIVRDGIRRMYHAREPIFYYLTVQNEPYPHPAMPEGVEDGILRGLYKFRAARDAGKRPRVHLFGSGAILREALVAQETLEQKFGVAADVWSATSYLLLRRDALACERWNFFHPEQGPRIPYVTRVLAEEPFPVVATSDYMKAVPDQIARWVPGGMRSLGTDGFGRSEARAELRDYFEIDAKYTAFAALQELARIGKFDRAKLADARKSLDINPEKLDPAAVPRSEAQSQR